MKKFAAALAGLSLAAAPAAAQTATGLQPAAEASVGASGESAQFDDRNQTVGFVLLGAFAIASAYALIEIFGGDDDGGFGASPD